MFHILNFDPQDRTQEELESKDSTALHVSSCDNQIFHLTFL